MALLTHQMWILSANVLCVKGHFHQLWKRNLYQIQSYIEHLLIASFLKGGLSGFRNRPSFNNTIGWVVISYLKYFSAPSFCAIAANLVNKTVGLIYMGPCSFSFTVFWNKSKSHNWSRRLTFAFDNNVLSIPNSSVLSQFTSSCPEMEAKAVDDGYKSGSSSKNGFLLQPLQTFLHHYSHGCVLKLPFQYATRSILRLTLKEI